MPLASPTSAPTAARSTLRGLADRRSREESHRDHHNARGDRRVLRREHSRPINAGDELQRDGGDGHCEADRDCLEALHVEIPYEREGCGSEAVASAQADYVLVGVRELSGADVA